MSAEPSLKVGDRVISASGGPHMEITKIGDGVAQCAYWTKGKAPTRRLTEVPLTNLKKVERHAIGVGVRMGRSAVRR